MNIKCPKDIGFVNTFSEKVCEQSQFYGDCFHCWSSSIADMKHKEVYRVLVELTNKGMYRDAYGRVCSADEIFASIYSSEVLDLLQASLTKEVEE